MVVTIRYRYPCPICGYRCEVGRITSVRVNKRSIRVLPRQGPELVFAFGCRECGARESAPARDTDASYIFRPTEEALHPSDQSKVDDIRARRWGVAA